MNKGKKFNNMKNKMPNQQRAPRFQQNPSQMSQMGSSQSQQFFKNGITQNTQNSQDISQNFSQNMLTQGPLSQGFLSQPGLSQNGLSQAEFSQDSYLEHYQSQAEGLLSQDSTYQADSSYFAHSQTGGMMLGHGGFVNSNMGGNGPNQMSQF